MAGISPVTAFTRDVATLADLLPTSILTLRASMSVLGARLEVPESPGLTIGVKT